MTYYVSSGTLNPIHSHHSLQFQHRVSILLYMFSGANRLMMISDTNNGWQLKNAHLRQQQVHVGLVF